MSEEICPACGSSASSEERRTGEGGCTLCGLEASPANGAGLDDPHRHPPDSLPAGPHETPRPGGTLIKAPRERRSGKERRSGPGSERSASPISPVAGQLEDRRSGDERRRPATPFPADHRGLEQALSEGFRARYEVIEHLGDGGMGTVYLAVQKSFDRQVAIKFMRADSASLRDRFEREGRVLAHLDHPHVVRVFDQGDEAGHLFLVQEYVRGRGLDRLLETEGTLGPREAVRLGAEIADGLCHAHEKAVLHRDIKPANVLLDDKRSAKLADFGLSRELHTEKRTRDGTVLGTPGYMAPEVACGGEASAAADIYSLGVVLHEMVCGKLPFEAGDSGSYVKAQLTDRPTPPSASRTDLPPGYDAIVLRCLAREPRDRFSSAREVTQALQDILWSLPEDATAGDGLASGRFRSDSGGARRRSSASARIPGRRVSWKGAALGASLVAAGLLIAVVSWRPGRDLSDPSRDRPTLAALPANAQGYEEYLHLFDGTILIRIPPGKFTRRVFDEESGATRTQVTDLDPFYIAKQPVTNEQFRKFVEATGYRTSVEREESEGGITFRQLELTTLRGADWKTPFGQGMRVCAAAENPRHPAVMISYKDAFEYCLWAGLRLPSEAEWERAACGTDGRLYSWGSEDPEKLEQPVGNFYDRRARQFLPIEVREMRGQNDGHEYTCAVDHPASGTSPCGAQGMLGNVWEWCEDPDDYDKEVAVLRGGSWTSGPDVFRNGYRIRFATSKAIVDTGFRPALTPSPGIVTSGS